MHEPEVALAYGAVGSKPSKRKARKVCLCDNWALFAFGTV